MQAKTIREICGSREEQWNRINDRACLSPENTLPKELLGKEEVNKMEKR